MHESVVPGENLQPAVALRGMLTRNEEQLRTLDSKWQEEDSVNHWTHTIGICVVAAHFILQCSTLGKRNLHPNISE